MKSILPIGPTVCILRVWSLLQSTPLLTISFVHSQGTLNPLEYHFYIRLPIGGSPAYRGVAGYLGISHQPRDADVPTILCSVRGLLVHTSSQQ